MAFDMMLQGKNPIEWTQNLHISAHVLTIVGTSVGLAAPPGRPGEGGVPKRVEC